jgi:DNA-binding response OmpR family regulator
MEDEVAFLQKPFSAEALLERVRALLDDNPAASSGSHAPQGNHLAIPRDSG